LAKRLLLLAVLALALGLGIGLGTRHASGERHRIQYNEQYRLLSVSNILCFLMCSGQCVAKRLLALGLGLQLGISLGTKETAGVYFVFRHVCVCFDCVSAVSANLVSDCYLLILSELPVACWS
jgi:hypothetical protein